MPGSYDALIAKVITHGANRAEAIAKMRCALDELIIGGIRTNVPLHQALLREPDVLAGKMSTRTIERLVARGFDALKAPASSPDQPPRSIPAQGMSECSLAFASFLLRLRRANCWTP